MTNTLTTPSGDMTVKVSASEKRLVESYAEFMGRETPKIIEEYKEYKQGDGEVSLEDSRPYSIVNWVRERIDIDNMSVCDVCDDIVHGAYEYDGEMVCRRCEEDDLREPMASVVHSEFDRSLKIGHYRNQTKEEFREGFFEAEWVSTDGWRGYVSINASEEWSLVESKNVLTSWNDKDVKKLDEELKRLSRDFEVEWARVVSRTSNVFSSNFDFYVKGSESDEFLEAVEERL